MPANLESSAMATGLEKVSIHSNPKERQCQRMFKLPYSCTLFTCQHDYAQNPSSSASAVREPRNFRCSSWIQKRQRTRYQIASIHWMIEKANIFPKISTSDLLTLLKPLIVWITTNWNILNEQGIPDHITCLLRILYAEQEATVGTGHGAMGCFQTWKGVH